MTRISSGNNRITYFLFEPVGILAYRDICKSNKIGSISSQLSKDPKKPIFKWKRRQSTSIQVKLLKKYKKLRFSVLYEAKNKISHNAKPMIFSFL
jgi:hypothetical protein